MFYSCELDKVTSRLMDRPALQYVYQDTAGLAQIDNFLIKESYFKIALNFIGNDSRLLIPSRADNAILLESHDKKRAALLQPLNLKPGDIKTTEWDVLDDFGNVLFTTKNLLKAESFGFTVKLHK